VERQNRIARAVCRYSKNVNEEHFQPFASVPIWNMLYQVGTLEGARCDAKDHHVQDVTIPAVGMAMTEALLIRWLKEPGDPVAEGEPIAEIETDKSAMDLESPAAGVLGRHLFEAGAMVSITSPVCRILDAGDTETTDESAEVSTPEEASTAQPPVFEGIFDELRHGAAESSPVAEGIIDQSASQLDHQSERRAPHTSSPRQRRLAREAADRAATAPVAANGRRREAIAARVSESWRTIPHFGVTRDIDASAVVSALAELRATRPDATLTDFLLHAFATAVATLPGGGESTGDVGLAVATPDGVMMPIIAGADQLAVGDLIEARQAATRRGREGRMSALDVSGQPIGSLSNLGALRVDSFTGIIPLGQLCLLTVGRIAPRLVVTAAGFAARQSMTATLNVDHRAVDGDVAARALDVFAQTFESVQSWVKGEQQ
jgi:pyruvate dehydrogenase E2 component (dihydrolipoamide acetyltransferase)